MSVSLSPRPSDASLIELDQARAEALLYREAECLDQHRWDEWLALYAEDAVFWVPSWIDFSRSTSNPDTELSLIYYSARARIEERVWRLQSGQSPASVPLSRTLHSISNVRLAANEPGIVHANAVVHAFNPRRRETTVQFGTYRLRLVCNEGRLLIAEKKIILLNDYLPSSIDIYTV